MIGNRPRLTSGLAEAQPAEETPVAGKSQGLARTMARFNYVYILFIFLTRYVLFLFYFSKKQKA